MSRHHWVKSLQPASALASSEARAEGIGMLACNPAAGGGPPEEGTG